MLHYYFAKVCFLPFATLVYTVMTLSTSRNLFASVNNISIVVMNKGCSVLVALYICFLFLYPTLQAGKASDDLLQLAGNPFADMLSAPGGQAAPAPAAVPAQPYTNGRRLLHLCIHFSILCSVCFDFLLCTFFFVPLLHA